MCKMKNCIAVFLGLSFFITLACQEPKTGLSPVGTIPVVPRKELVTTFGTANPHFVRTVLHVDLEKQNPLNANDFFFGWFINGEPYDDHPFFEHVVLGYSYLSQNAQGNVILNMTPALQYVLDNNSVYIRPLILKGIKVLIEVRSGNFSDDEPGFFGVGLGAMDMPAVNQFAPQLKNLIDRYGIDGFEFNDTGGGYRAYPPYTRHLTKFDSAMPLYPDEMFQDDNGGWLDESETDKILWREGGANFADIIVYINEHLKERRRVPADFGSALDDGHTIEIIRSLIARSDKGHGRYMHTETRQAFTPDAYTGATTYVLWNMAAFVNGIANKMEAGFPFLEMWDNFLGRKVRQEGSFFSPFVVDLSVEDRPSASAARDLGRNFAGTSGAPNRFGTLYFSNLPALEEDSDIAAYLTNFTTPIFGRPVFLYEGGGNHGRLIIKE